MLVPITLALLATVTGAYEYGPFFVYALALGLGFLVPDFWLGNRISARQLKIRLGLPEALDLMVICIEAGLSLDQATVRVADEMQLSEPEISDELSLVNLEQRAGRPRADAWRNLAERTDVDTVRALVRHADSSRSVRHQRGQDSARLFGHAADATPPAGGGTGREDHGEAGVSAGALYFSIFVRGGARPVADCDGRVI